MRNSHYGMQSIEDRLRAERGVHRAPDGLSDRVMANLAADGSADRHAAGFSFWPRFAVAFASVALVAAGFFHFMRPGSEPSPSQQMVAAAPVEPLNIAIPTLQTVPIQNFTMHLDQPLEKELQNVISDTRQAIQFVAASFLPEN